LLITVLLLGVAAVTAAAATREPSQPEPQAIAMQAANLGPADPVPTASEGPSETSLQVLGIAALVLFALSIRALGDDRQRR
jgi:hypothetical protein